MMKPKIMSWCIEKQSRSKWQQRRSVKIPLTSSLIAIFSGPLLEVTIISSTTSSKSLEFLPTFGRSMKRSRPSWLQLSTTRRRLSSASCARNITMHLTPNWFGAKCSIVIGLVTLRCTRPVVSATPKWSRCSLIAESLRSTFAIDLETYPSRCLTMTFSMTKKSSKFSKHT